MMSYACNTAFAFPSDLPSTAVSTSPFHDCLDSGKEFNECRAHSRGLKRDVQISPSPFHDCMSQPDATLANCTTEAGLVARSDDSSSETNFEVSLNERGIPFNFKGFMDDMGTKLGGS